MAPISPSERDRWQHAVRLFKNSSTPTTPRAAGYGWNSNPDASPLMTTETAGLNTEAKPDDRAPAE